MRILVILAMLFAGATATVASATTESCHDDQNIERDLVRSYLANLSSLSVSTVEAPRASANPILVHAFALQEVHRISNQIEQVLRQEGLLDGPIEHRLRELSSHEHNTAAPLETLSSLHNDYVAAVNLVVDTGIYNRRWTRVQAIRYVRTVMGTDLATAISFINKRSTRTNDGQTNPYLAKLKQSH